MISTLVFSLLFIFQPSIMAMEENKQTQSSSFDFAEYVEPTSELSRDEKRGIFLFKPSVKTIEENKQTHSSSFDFVEYAEPITESTINELFDDNTDPKLRKALSAEYPGFPDDLTKTDFDLLLNIQNENWKQIDKDLALKENLITNSFRKLAKKKLIEVVREENIRGFYITPKGKNTLCAVMLGI